MPRKPSRRRSKKRSSGTPSQARRRMLLECLEPRVVLTGTPLAAGEGEGSISLSLFVDGQQEVLPANIGVQADGSRADTFTVGNQGEIFFTPDSGLTLDSFFDTWRTGAGLAGNNAASSFSVNDLLGNSTDSVHLVKMFVNGQVSLNYEDHVLQDGDQISIVHTDKPVTSLNTNFGSILVELFELDTPGTVDNFLNYVNDGDYINSFFHRGIADFVIQGGGFTTSSTTFANTGQFGSVPTDAPIVNEPGISNTRGTIAMAKTSNPDSATSQFFFNLTDNLGLNSPTNSGGFTVFGQVLDMTVADTIAAFPTSNNGGAFTDLPLATGNQLSVIESVAGHGELVGEKFLDINANGARDAGEGGIPNAIIFIDANGNETRDAGELFTVTDANGGFRLAVAPGTHNIFSELSGGSQTRPSVGYEAAVAIGRDTVGLDFGETPLPAPFNIDLVAASDTGDSDTDNLTNLNNAPGRTLQFQVSGGVTGAEMFIFVDGVSVGSATVSSDTVTVTTDGLTTLDDGVRRIEFIQAFQQSELGQSPRSTPLDITIDSTAPGLVDNIPVTAREGVFYSFDAMSSDDATDPPTFGLVDPPAGMTIDPVTGIVSWTPTFEQTVPQVLMLTATDAAGNTATLVKNLTVLLAVPALPDSYAATEDTTLVIAAGQGLLVNDGDASSGSLTAELVSPPTNGSVTLAQDGSFSYMPDADFAGADSFTYRAFNGTEFSNVALVSIDVAAVDDIPQAVADTYTLDEDVPLSVDAAGGVLANDTDVDGDPLTATAIQQPTNGTLNLNADGSFVYTPTANFAGGDSFTYTLTDGTTTTSEVTVGLTVSPVNDLPLANDDGYTVVEDGSLSVVLVDGVLSNDSDVESTLSASLVISPTSGSIDFSSDGTFTYTPNADFFGSDTFTYAASDGIASTEAMVTLTVTGIPDAPQAVDDAETATNGGRQFTFNVLSNDTTQPDGVQDLSVTAVTVGTQGGTIENLGTGIAYTAPIGFIGEERFSYTVTDADELTSTAEVVVTVREQANSTIMGHVFLDSDADGQHGPNELPFQGAQVNLTGTPEFGAPVSRSVLTDANGVFLFDELPAGTYQLQENQPAGAVNGSQSAPGAEVVVAENMLSNIVLGDDQVLGGFQFSELAIVPEFVTIQWLFASRLPLQSSVVNAVADAEEQAGNTELANNIRANSNVAPPPPVNAGPTAVNDSYQVAEGTPLVVTAGTGLLANDSDPDQDPLTASVRSPASNGTVMLSADGGFTYTPNAAFTGQDTFTYQSFDGQAFSNTATVSIDVQPTINPTTFAVVEDSPNGTTIGTLSETDTVLYQFAPPSSEPAQLVLRPDDHLSGNIAGSVVLIEYADFQCPACAAFVPILAQLKQDFPDDLLVVTRHLPLTSIHPNALEAAVAAEAAARQDAFDGMHDLLFARQQQWSGLADPGAFFESLATELGLNLTQFRSDVADTALVERVNRDLTDAGSLGLSSTPSFFLAGTAIANPSSQANFNAAIQSEVDGLSSPFRLDRATGALTVRDTTLLSSASQPQHILSLLASDVNAVQHDVQVTINVTEAAGATPVAVDDAYTVDEGAVLEVPASTGVLNNDTDADGDTLSATVVQTTSNGTLALLSTGQFAYTPAANFLGQDTFTYRASDGTSSSTATVTITVEGNTAPVASNDEFTVTEDSTLTVSAGQGILVNDTDADGDMLVAQVVSQPANGTLTLNVSGAFTYIPNANFNGTDSFTYLASDGLLDSTAAATVTLNVTSVEDTPIAARDEYHTSPNQTLTVSAADGVLRNDSDGDGDALTVSFVAGGTNGGVVLASEGSFTYTPFADFTGNDSFIYEVTDGALVSQTTVDLTVTSADLASFRVETTSLTGIPRSSIEVGDSFLVRVFADDLRNSEVGVEAAFLDLQFDTNLVSLDSNVAFDPLFTNTTVDTTVNGLLNELGGSREDLTPLGNSETLLASMIFRADAIGNATFTTDPADDPNHETVLLRDPIGIPVEQIFFGATAIDIVAGATGEPFDFGFEDSVDEIMAGLGDL